MLYNFQIDIRDFRIKGDILVFFKALLEWYLHILIKLKIDS